jgi:Fe-S-cluster-containing dehydrogenase component
MIPALEQAKTVKCPTFVGSKCVMTYELINLNYPACFMVCSESANMDTWLDQANEEIVKMFVQSQDTLTASTLIHD